ncbi:MAG TPA: metallophosphoesterase family protein [Phycisphaerae bacterium]|mgnify:CR=1 FL=1|nr:metallophosphoesterase family protein [Phycisphaerae bacterium]HRR86039.1 metallophosphoesterase family protein [Phycisphaerae bacterium]
MRILILSDVHANPWALAAVERDAGRFDHVICAGDTVNYGPAPSIAVAWLRQHGSITVRGNHDHAVAFHADPKASPAKQPLAMCMRDWTRAQLGPDDMAWLARLPLSLQWEIGGVCFAVTHATPLDPLYDYRLTPQQCDAILDDVAAKVQADVLVLGHTHFPLTRRRGSLQIVNPGSLGQPLDGDVRAPYVLWEDGVVHCRRAEYDLEPVICALRQLPAETIVQDDLVAMLQQATILAKPVIATKEAAYPTRQG